MGMNTYAHLRGDTSADGSETGIVTLAGTMPGTFHGTCLVNPAAGERAAVQFWNPAASGVNAVIEDIYLQSSGADGDLTIYASTAALTTEEATYSTVAMHPDEAQTVQCEMRTDVDNAGAGAVWSKTKVESSAHPFQVGHLIGKTFAPGAGVSFYDAGITSGQPTTALTVVWREVAV